MNRNATQPHHPRIPVWLRPIVRRPGEVQFGVLPGGPIVSGVTPAEAAVLALLDGSRSVPASFRAAADAGVAPMRWRELLDLVSRLDVLQPLEVSSPAQVQLDGSGALAEEIAAGLRRCGIVPQMCREPGSATSHTPETGRTAGLDLTRAVHTMPHLVVLVAEAAMDPRRGDRWLERGVSHLPVVAQGPHMTIGPLVTTEPDHPCLWCLDLHRTDRDGAWPALMAQVCGTGRITSPAHGGAAGDAALDPLLGQLVSACVGLYATRLLRGESPPVGVSVDLSLAWPRMDHRRWLPHPRCSRHGDEPTGAGPSVAVA